MLISWLTVYQYIYFDFCLGPIYDSFQCIFPSSGYVPSTAVICSAYILIYSIRTRVYSLSFFFYEWCSNIRYYRKSRERVAVLHDIFGLLYYYPKARNKKGHTGPIVWW